MGIFKLFSVLLCMVINMTIAAPSHLEGQGTARRQITRWQNSYNQYIEATIMTRTTGCTTDNIVYRREWWVPILS